MKVVVVAAAWGRLRRMTQAAVMMGIPQPLRNLGMTISRFITWGAKGVVVRVVVVVLGGKAILAMIILGNVFIDGTYVAVVETCVFVTIPQVNFANLNILETRTANTRRTLLTSHGSSIDRGFGRQSCRSNGRGPAYDGFNRVNRSGGIHFDDVRLGLGCRGLDTCGIMTPSKKLMAPALVAVRLDQVDHCWYRNTQSSDSPRNFWKNQYVSFVFRV